MGILNPHSSTKPWIRLSNALRAVRKDNLSIQKAAKAHCVSNKTLQPRLKDLSQGYGIKKAKPGRRPALTEEEESIAVNKFFGVSA